MRKVSKITNICYAIVLGFYIYAAVLGKVSYLYPLFFFFMYWLMVLFCEVCIWGVRKQFHFVAPADDINVGDIIKIAPDSRQAVVMDIWGMDSGEIIVFCYPKKKIKNKQLESLDHWWIRTSYKLRNL